MGLEREKPNNLEEAREIVQEFIVHRPVIHHNQISLQKMLTEEMAELEAAVLAGTPAEILAETGDVLFSFLALDDGKSAVYPKIYAVISQFSENYGLPILDLFNQTHDKNRINYPLTFFNHMTPFENAPDAISCLRIFRQQYGSPDNLNEFWVKLDEWVAKDAPFFDG